jgi:ubiquitin-activating enzyme E1
MSEVVKMVSKKDIEPWVNSLVLEICCNDLDGEDVEVSAVFSVVELDPDPQGS